MWLVVVSNIISHIIQFEATFCMTSKENPHCGLNVAAVTTVTNPHIIHIEATFGKLEIRSQIGAYKCGFYNPHNSDYLLLWLQSRLCGLCGLFQPQIIWIKGTFNPHFIIREAMKCIVHNDKNILLQFIIENYY